MGLFSMFKQNRDVKPQQQLLWKSGTGIFNFIQRNLDGAGKLRESGDELPDEGRRYEKNAWRWAPGAMDGTFGHHGGEETIAEAGEVDRIVELMKAISETNYLTDKHDLYMLLAKDTVMSFIDDVLEKVSEAEISVYPHLYSYGRLLAFESPDRGAVKFGIALLGVIGEQEDLEKIIVLGKHEEFTLFAAVAVTHSLGNAEQTHWAMAKCVEGWGRIHLVERLATTEDPAIKSWLLREGYRNTVMYEYLAYTCAVAGGLKAELQREAVDDALLIAAGDIIIALINGGPAENMDQYEDGAEVTQLYVAQLEKRATSLDSFLKLASIKQFLEDNDADWKARESKGWHEDMRSNLLIDLHMILSNQKWTRLVLGMQYVDDSETFWEVDQAANILGISLWDTHWKRLSDNPTDSACWYNIMKNANDERIDSIVTFAMDRLPLAKIATGVADELGVGDDYNLHTCLDYVLQDLRRFPGKGFNLIKTAMASPVTRNRNMAIRALTDWGTTYWPEEARTLLVQAGQVEPNAGTKKDILMLLNGKGIA